MSISPEHLPTELHYIIPLAQRHGSDARVARYDPVLGRRVRYGETLAAADIEALRRLYTEIKKNRHNRLINDWHHRHGTDAACPSETSWPVYGLLCLFVQLGELGVAPFDDGAVRPEAPAEALDWDKLPPPLRYLAGPAAAYGALQFEERIHEFLRERMSGDERAELRTLSVRYDQDYEAIRRWLDAFPMTKHPEAARVYFTGCLLGAGADLGLW